MKNVAIVGGGLAGLIGSIVLARKGIDVTLIEKKEYPFHRVCGEYISNETVPFLRSQKLFPDVLSPIQIKNFQLTAVNGRSATLPLDMGGFGISRYAFDYFLFQEAIKSGVHVIQNQEVASIEFNEEEFLLKLLNSNLVAAVVLCAFGKRSKLDVDWKRSFSTRRSPYVGIKHHLRTDYQTDLIALHNFEGGYCGISNIEDGKTNLCYLVHRDKLRQAGSISMLEENWLKKNPWLKSILNNSDFLFDRPETINEISFDTKGPVFNRMLMIGDAAGMITPLCGNGMAMAIRSGKMAADLTAQFCKGKLNRVDMENQYARNWQHTFSRQLWFGRQVQNLFANEFTSNLAVQLAVRAKWVAQAIIRGTHGEECE